MDGQLNGRWRICHPEIDAIHALLPRFASVPQRIPTSPIFGRNA
jgi:hypothetical protein